MIGRVDEVKSLRSAYASDHSEFVAIYGRRRVGKTFLINEVFNYKIPNGFFHKPLKSLKTWVLMSCVAGCLVL